MIDSRLCLFDRNQVVAPALLEINNEPRFSLSCQINSFSVGISLAIAVECLLQHLHFLIKLSGFLEHSGLVETGSYFLKNILGETGTVVINHVSCSCRKPSLKIQLNGLIVIPLILFDFGCLLFLVGFQEPLKVFGFEVCNIRMLLLLGNVYSLCPLVELLIHIHSLIVLTVLEENSLGSMELFVKHCQLSLNLVIADSVCSSCILLILLDQFQYLP